VIVQTEFSVALYCQQCGKIHVHDVPYFIGSADKIIFHCKFKHEQATLIRTKSHFFRLRIPCVVCNSVHEAVFSLHQLMRMKVEKIYCAKDFFELGYIGKRQEIKEILMFNRQGFEILEHENHGEKIEKQQILLEAINRIHDIAEAGGIICPCGSKAIEADVLGSAVRLTCCHCGNYELLAAGRERDLDELDKLVVIDLLQRSLQVKNIDLD